MKLNGSFEVPGNRDQVYAFLTDPGKVVAALPDVQSSKVEEDRFTVDAKVGVGPMRGVMSVHLNIVEREPSQRAVYKGQGKGLGSTVDMMAAFTLRDAGTGTTVDWDGDAKIGGRLSSWPAACSSHLPKRILRSSSTRFARVSKREPEHGNHRRASR